MARRTLDVDLESPAFASILREVMAPRPAPAPTPAERAAVGDAFAAFAASCRAAKEGR